MEVDNEIINHKGMTSELSAFEGLTRVWALLDDMASSIDVKKPWEACGAAEMDRITFKVRERKIEIECESVSKEREKKLKKMRRRQSMVWRNFQGFV